MKISISGSTGFIGKTLTWAFIKRNWTVESISRNDFHHLDQLQKKVSGADVIIHLAGAPIIKRWTKAYKQEIYSSRVETTRKITEAIRSSPVKPKLFISTSAVGILKGGQIYNERNAELGDGFIGELCKDWEQAALGVNDQTRVVIFRLAVILDKNAGALRKMLWPFKSGLGGRIGTGRQLFSWIHSADLIRAYIYVIEQESIHGVIHLASPETATNNEYTRILGKVLRRPAIIPIPVIVLKMLFGEAASTLSEGQGAFPEILINSGFRFQYPKLEEALRDLLS